MQVSGVLDVLVRWWYLALGAFSLPTYGHHEQDPLGARNNHAHVVLPAWGDRGMAANCQRNEVLQVPELAGPMAEDEEAAGIAHAPLGQHAREGLFSSLFYVTT